MNCGHCTVEIRINVEGLVMDERQARLQGIEIHRREMAFVKGYVTCTNCGCNYHCRTEEPTFCQAYSRVINPEATEENIFMAESCQQWVAKCLDRNSVVHPDHHYSYEDWEE